MVTASWVEPFLGVAGVNLHPDSFAESPGPAALVGGSQNYDYGITTLGLRGETSMLAWALLTLNGTIGWQQVFGGETPNSTLAFASLPFTPFSIAGAPIARNALALEAGLDWRLTASAKLGVYYSGLLSSSASDNAIKAKLEASF
jgi:outer membrane autotransporter protein